MKKEDRFWINTWMFFVIIVVLACFIMGVLFVMNNAIQNSDEATIEEIMAVEGITYELWNEFKILIPTMIIILIISAWVYIKFSKRGCSE